MMIAHSLRGEMFGPAQRLHGATYVVDVTFRRASLDADGVVVDIGRAAAVLAEVVGGLGYRNLDDEPSLAGINTTTEALARVIADRLPAPAAPRGPRAGARALHRLAAHAAAGDLGAGARDLDALAVTLHESHIASASYERAL